MFSILTLSSIFSLWACHALPLFSLKNSFSFLFFFLLYYSLFLYPSQFFQNLNFNFFGALNTFLRLGKKMGYLENGLFGFQQQSKSVDLVRHGKKISISSIKGCNH
jgi:hypothetical protein